MVMAIMYIVKDTTKPNLPPMPPLPIWTSERINAAPLHSNVLYGVAGL
jgi:hypothetical protein